MHLWARYIVPQWISNGSVLSHLKVTGRYLPRISGKEIYSMRKINGKKFFTIYEISYLLKKEFTPDDLKLRIENEELPGLKIGNEWHINEETVNFLVDVMINHKIDCSRIFGIKEQKVNLNNIKLEGLILDIGGGGEGVIGQFKKDKVIEKK